MGGNPEGSRFFLVLSSSRRSGMFRLRFFSMKTLEAINSMLCLYSTARSDSLAFMSDCIGQQIFHGVLIECICVNVGLPVSCVSCVSVFLLVCLYLCLCVCMCCFGALVYFFLVSYPIIAACALACLLVAGLCRWLPREEFG